MYLPSFFIYKDFKELNWIEEIDKNYKVINGTLYQSNMYNGSYVNKYFCGVALLQSPFFLGAHGIAKLGPWKADGFSWPYQFSILIAALSYFGFGLLLLYKTLKNYYDEAIYWTFLKVSSDCFVALIQ